MAFFLPLHIHLHMLRKEDHFILGYVKRTVGTQGELVLQLDADNPQRYAKLDAVLLEVNGALTPFFITKTHLREDQLTVKIEGLDELFAAKEYIGSTCWLPLSVLPQLDDQHFYFHEVRGFELIDAHYGPVGIISEVMDRLMQPVVIAKNGYKEVLVPLADGVLQRVDRAEKKMYVNTPEGLIGLYLNDDSAQDDGM